MLLKKDGKFQVKIDASGHTIGEVLSQKQEKNRNLLLFCQEQCNQ